MYKDKQNQGDAPEFSILIGLVSSVDRGRILETLDSLRNQSGSHRYEVIIADRRQDDISSSIDTGYPEVQMIACPVQTSLPELRTRALRRARGMYIIVTEDHCVPPDNWLASISRAFTEAPPGTVAVGGCVENGIRGTALDRATFLCEYSNFLEPVAEGVVTVLPGMNIAYHHSVFDNLADELLSSGFWETTAHPVLLEKGLKLFSSNKIRMYHSKKFSFGLFARQRFLYSRYYGDLRFPRNRVLNRILACLATLLLPPVLLYRTYRHIKTRNRPPGEFRSAMPVLLVFYLVWACGEMTGYLFGSGDALARIE
jgi:hypothetical protein